MITAEVSQHIYSNAPGSVGNWSWRATMIFAECPRVGDFIVLPSDEAVEVKVVYWFAGAPPDSGLQVGIELRPVTTNSPQEVESMGQRRKDWEQLGGPWENQG